MQLSEPHFFFPASEPLLGHINPSSKNVLGVCPGGLSCPIVNLAAALCEGKIIQWENTQLY